MNIEIKRNNKVINNEDTAMKDSLTVIGALPNCSIRSTKSWRTLTIDSKLVLFYIILLVFFFKLLMFFFFILLVLEFQPDSSGPNPILSSSSQVFYIIKLRTE